MEENRYFLYFHLVIFIIAYSTGKIGLQQKINSNFSKLKILEGLANTQENF